MRVLTSEAPTRPHGVTLLRSRLMASKMRPFPGPEEKPASRPRDLKQSPGDGGWSRRAAGGEQTAGVCAEGGRPRPPSAAAEN